jgi:hypothetical protein
LVDILAMSSYPQQRSLSCRQRHGQNVHSLVSTLDDPQDPRTVHPSPEASHDAMPNLRNRAILPVPDFYSVARLHFFLFSGQPNASEASTRRGIWNSEPAVSISPMLSLDPGTIRPFTVV